MQKAQNVLASITIKATECLSNCANLVFLLFAGLTWLSSTVVRYVIPSSLPASLLVPHADDAFIFQATKIHQRTFGNNHPITARSLELMATVYAEIGKTEYSGKNPPEATGISPCWENNRISEPCQRLACRTGAEPSSHDMHQKGQEPLCFRADSMERKRTRARHVVLKPC